MNWFGVDYGYLLGKTVAEYYFPLPPEVNLEFREREATRAFTMPNMIRIYVQQGPSWHVFRLSCSEKRIFPKDVFGITNYRELEAEVKIYQREISDLILGAHFGKKTNAYAVFQQAEMSAAAKMVSSLLGTSVSNRDGSKVERKKEPEFEMNLTEALVGWKAWRFLPDGMLCTRGGSFRWYPGISAKAHACSQCGGIENGNVIPVHEFCTCGIYASDKKEAVSGYGNVIGQVYGWGRYIRGDSGWRAEFAYPKAFYLTPGQENFIDKLQAYYVPIYCYEPMKVYDPKEDGYDENWGDEENRSLRTDQDSSPEKD